MHCVRTMEKLAAELLSLETFKVNRETFHSASSTQPWPGSRILHTPNRLIVLTKLQKQALVKGASGMETPEKGTPAL